MLKHLNNATKFRAAKMVPKQFMIYGIWLDMVSLMITYVELLIQPGGSITNFFCWCFHVVVIKIYFSLLYAKRPLAATRDNKNTSVYNHRPINTFKKKLYIPYH
ncbi:hypothetical protein Hanom_Chr08g00698701 [Helianthus anomalus]